MVSILIISCKFNFSSSHAMYLKLLITRIACFWLSTVVFYSRLRLNSITVFSTSTRFGTFHPARLIRMCWIASKISTWNKQFKQQKKDDQTNLNIKEGVFKCWNAFFVRYDLQSNVAVFLVWFVQKIEGRDWRLPKTIEYELHGVLNSSDFTGCKLKF